MSSVLLPPPAFINHVLDDGTIVGQSQVRGGHPDADVPADPSLPPAAEIEAFMQQMEAEQANAIVYAEFKRDSDRALNYVKQCNPDAMISVSRTYGFTSIDLEARARYCVVIFGPQLTQIGAGHGDTMNEAACEAVHDMRSREQSRFKAAAAS